MSYPHAAQRHAAPSGLPPFEPVLSADDKKTLEVQAQSQHPVKWDDCEVEKYIYIYGHNFRLRKLRQSILKVDLCFQKYIYITTWWKNCMSRCDNAGHGLSMVDRLIRGYLGVILQVV